MTYLLGTLLIFSWVYYLSRGMWFLADIYMHLWLRWQIWRSRDTPGEVTLKFSVIIRFAKVSRTADVLERISQELSGFYLLSTPYQVKVFVADAGDSVVGRAWNVIFLSFWLYDAWNLWKSGGSGRWKKRGKRALSAVRQLGSRLVVVPVGH